jgi:hypothetical protein
MAIKIKHSSYRRDDIGNSRDWQRGEMFSKSKSNIKDGAKPRDVDSLLDRGMLIWAMKHLIRITFLPYDQ